MLKRIIIYVAGILILALGLILNTKTGLGVAPINSVAYAAAAITGLTFGTCTFLQYLVFIAFQILVYRKITVRLLLQIPFSYVMGALLDLYDLVITISPASLPGQLLLLFCAVFFTALGAYLMVTMDFIVNPADGATQAFSVLLRQEFGQAKWKFDCSMMALTAVLSFVILRRPVGLGIGTVCSALFVGRLILVCSRLLGPHLTDCAPKRG